MIEAKLENMTKTQYFEHTDKNGCTFECRITKYYPRSLDHDVRENLYHGICDESNAYNLWIKSPTHKANLDKIPGSDFIIFKMVPDNANDGRNWCYATLEIVRY